MNKQKPQTQEQSEHQQDDPKIEKPGKKVKEIGGPEGPEPTRYGDWEIAGRCSDF